MSTASEKEKEVTPPQAQTPLPETNTAQLLQQSANSRRGQVDPISAIVVLVTATIGAGQILTGPGRFGLLGSITGLLFLGILLVYGSTTYTWKQSLIYSAAVGLSILQIFGFLFNDLFDKPGFFFQMNQGDFLSFGLWFAATLITFLFKIRYPEGLKNR